MSTPRLFLDYPIEYSELLRHAMKKPIRIPFNSKVEAIRLRNHIYGFRTSIAQSDNAPDDLVLTAPLISFEIDGTTLVVSRPKRTFNIRKALANDKD